MTAQRTIVLLMTSVVSVAGCIGGQSEQTRRSSDALGDRSRDVPVATLRERDWKAAATGHAAAGQVPADELARMEKRSAPGGNLDVDANPADAGSPR